MTQSMLINLIPLRHVRAPGGCLVLSILYPFVYSEKHIKNSPNASEKKDGKNHIAKLFAQGLVTCENTLLMTTLYD